MILHVLYAEEDKSLSGVYDTLKFMLTFSHLKEGAHPVVAACAREMLNKTENELSASDFTIRDLMNSEHPVSLYLVVPPIDIERTKPLMRLVLNQLGRRLTEKIEYGKGKKHYQHRLLMMLDEFPSLGRLGFFESELAYMAGYGINCVMIAQSLNQIEMAYGPNNSILDNSHVRITYGALDERTAKRISDLLGQATEKRLQMNFAGNRLSPWLGHIMESEQETPRPLLTPGEILQLPGDDALVMIGGLPPYRAKKLMYYQDERFRERAWLPAPDDPDEQYAELLKKGECNSWFDPAACKVQRADVPSGEVCWNSAAESGTVLPDEEGSTEDRAFLHRDDPDDFSHEESIPENTLAVEDAVINRNGSQFGRSPIIDLSRTPQGGHLPL